jgi:hypothetical protein
VKQAGCDNSRLDKLGLRDRVAAVVFAFQHGLASPGGSRLDAS